MVQRSTDYQINDTTFRVTYGDITKIEADGLVSSDDSNLSMSGGVSWALREAGGEAIQQDARKHIPLELGEVVVTTAGRLPAKYIFHAVTIDKDKMVPPDEASIETITRKCLGLADTLGVKRLAFPALGTGRGDFPFQLAAEIMTRTIADYLMGDTQIELVTLALFAAEEVTLSDLNAFYERTVAIASVAAQGRQLGTLLTQLQKIVEPMQKPDLARRLAELQAELLQAQTVLGESSTTPAELDELEERSGIAAVSRQAVEISSETQETIAWENQQLEAEVLRTKLGGLLTQLNIHYSNLNKLQIKKAKYGIDVPLHLENAVEDTQGEIEEIEARVQETRMQLARLTTTS